MHADLAQRLTFTVELARRAGDPPKPLREKQTPWP